MFSFLARLHLLFVLVCFSLIVCLLHVIVLMFHLKSEDHVKLEYSRTCAHVAVLYSGAVKC